jgi:hypothetical protein
MQSNVGSLIRPLGYGIFVLTGLFLAGCSSGNFSPASATPPAATQATLPPPPPAPLAPAVVPTVPAPKLAAAIRIDAGSSTAYTDSEGNLWLPDQGFDNPEGVVDRGDIAIANTKDPALYRTEHYSMNTFSIKVPNGRYTVKLHFAETYTAEVNAPGERVFTINVAGHELKDFDVVAKAGGTLRAYVEAVDVDVTDGALKITFTPTTQNSEINGIEIIPRN